jgi:hypothetical protein
VLGTSNDAAGVFGWSTSNSGVGGISGSGNGVQGNSSSGTGVHGESAGSSGTPYGVYGLASDAGSATSYGVYGESNSSVGTGVGGEAPMNGVYGKATKSSGGYGVYGDATGSAGTPYGVYGIASHTGSATSYGVYGESNSSVGTGVGGEAPMNGVYGMATNSGGYGVYGYCATGHGVHGKADTPDGYGIYSEGNAFVEGELFWEGKTSYVAVATSAFIPELYGDTGHVEYDNEGYYLQNEDTGGQWFTAPVQLPHKATVTKLMVGWRDGSDVTATVYLKRRSMFEVTQMPESMAAVSSQGSVGSIKEGVWSDTMVSNAAVDNEKYTYYLEVLLPSASEDIKLYGVSIEYTIYEPY